MSNTLVPQQADDELPWAASVYYVVDFVNCPIERAWMRMLNYEEWNPSFAGARVTLVRGQRHTEGELVLIKKAVPNLEGQPWPAFYAETVKIVPGRHIVWYLYPKETDELRNFVDFGLRENGPGVNFTISYYAQSRLATDSLIQQRKQMEAALRELVTAFKLYCES